MRIIGLTGLAPTYPPVAAPPAPSYEANPDHFGLVKGWAATNGHLSGSGSYTIHRVTNLNASGPGSFRAALEAPGERLVVFETSGNINWAGATVNIDNPYITVAGQTAPSPGITVINGTINPRTHNGVIMHMKFRPGTGAGSGKDAMETRPGCRDFILSHCSFSWGTDGTLDIGGFNLNGSDPNVWRNITSRNITVDRCIIAESLTVGSGACLVEDNANAILFYGCMFSNSQHRMPLWKGGSRGAMINNLIYNGADKFTDSTLVASAWGSKAKQEVYLDAMGNYAQAGPNVSGTAAFHEVVSNYGTRYYGNDNIAKRTNGTNYPETVCIANTQSYNAGGYILVVGAEIQGGHGVVPIAATATPDFVEDSAGAFPWARDPIDARQFSDFRSGLGQHLSSQNQRGGYPLNVVNTRPFNPDHWDLTSAGVEPIHEDALS